MVIINHTESTNETIPVKKSAFRWTYIALPALILLISIILAVSFYNRLSPEVAYHFEDGSPDRWISRGAIVVWLVVPQFILVFMGAAISGGTTILSARILQEESTLVRKVLLIVGNMVVLPQIIIVFAMLDIFLYNAYRIHLLPLWIFVLIVMVLGAIILGIFFRQALRQSRGLSGKSLQE